ncbi:DNA-binding MurR/RpiR family transcriptional regulator [Allocatelliglobosispora scoriae]|uniref:DNA-binding MurR/RpiR family transcriptional regulator n=1 Tax=Allocatelliglobosispora scoriae TaxID=643052 RepID=A0A841BTR8_9ACTN|nr:MurR/RpiR family transcriptional regulator [Allocatelliglobosispora scoriae]MBB5870142.1 DNA-binding MurR/RpiR family transcriptional regulator [Allocatelliglobosispora scoriae]
MNVADLVHGVRLTPTQRRIARCLVEHAGQAAHLTAAEIAELAGVSQPSVTRFATALGYDGFPALRRRLRELATAAPVQNPENDLQGAVHTEIANLTRLAAQLGDRGPILTAAGLLAGSRPLPVLGLRSAAPIASYFGYFAAKVHPDVRVLDDGGSMLGDRLEQARGAGATALLAFVLPRYPRETLDALRDARDLGLGIVAITDSPVSPVTELADVVLPASVGSDLVFDLHTAPMVLTMVLLQAICDAMPAGVQHRLEEFETSAARRQIFTE